MKNLKNKIKLKYIIAGGIVAIIGIILFAIYSYNEHMEYIKNTNPELARAMTYEEVAEGDEEVEGTNNCVQFDAFFLRDLNGDGYAESIRGTSKEIGSEDTLYMELNVQTAGSLKNAKITVNGENFYLQTALPKDDELKDNYIGNNIKEIEFNDLANGTQKMITGIVRSGDYSYSSSKANAIGNNINNYSKVNNVTLTGTYVDEDGTETPITKTVDFNMDWYGTTRASIYTTSQNKNIEDALDEENGVVNLNFTVNTEETDRELILSKNHVEGEIPQLNGYNPTNVEYTGSNAVFNYDAEKRTFTLERTAEVDEEGNVTTSLSRSNSYGIRVIYPIEAYQSLGTETIEMKIPVNTYYEGYNNPNEEFTNPYKSNTAKATIVLTYEEAQETVSVSRFDVTVGKYVYNPTGRYIVSKQKPLKIYNGTSEEEKDDTYTVLWRAYIGTGENLPGIIMKETKTEEAQVTDQFIKTDSTEESVDDVISNIGIYFSGADNVLGEEGWIKVYDEETGNLLVTFTADDWNKYTSGNPYKYELPVKHIRVETSAVINDESYFYAYNIKEIYDDKVTEKYTKEQFDELQYIKSTLVGYVGETYVNTDTHQAHYEAPISVADIGISNNTISTQTTEKNEKLTITARKDSSSNQVGWVDGSFIVKLPEEILTAEINNVEINNSNVSITSYELAEENGVKLIKINTKNTNSTPQTYSITVDLNITPDPRMATANRNIELYASNEEASDYYYNNQDIYDVNNNLNTEELVNYDTASISMVSPNSLLTNQTASNYDDKGSTVVSPQVADIKPIYAVVDQEAEEQTATIGVQIRNNYASTISEIEILGKIPYEGNTYVLSGGELGSTFTTKMTNAGITVPAELQEYVTIYYSENENPDKDLGKAENGWKTADQVENWDNIKTYLIDFGNYVMPTGKEFVFNYTVKIPNGLEFNQVSYSHHGVYFCLDTDQGKYRTQTEPNRIGLRIAEKYNLELTKYQTGKDKLIPGATYSITEITTNEEGEEERGESKTGVTNAEGKITIVNLYAEKEYEIKEIKTPDDYELNSDVIRFIGHVDEEGVLTIEKKQGTTKGDFVVTKEEGEEYKVSVNVEDEVKASIKIIKKEQGSDTLIQGARFKLTGYGLSENGRTLTTNINGELTFKGISVNQEYTLQETKAEGYYLASPIKFKVVNNSGNYSIEVLEGEAGIVSAQRTKEVDSIPTITLNIENEKIPTYDLQLIKIKRTTESTVSDDELIAQAETALADTEVEYLAGAKFKLYKGTEEIGEYITDGTGKVTILGLYQYEEDKNVDQTYTLKEVLAPVGYAKVKDITFKAEIIDGSLVLKEINEEGEETDSTRYTAEGNTIQLTIEDSPSFKLIKKDAETQEVLAGIKFAIYNVEEGEVPATDSKGEIIGTQETINGREYYTVTTNENGEITADLPEGLYKAVEVEAPEKYDLEGQEYYFGIGASREAPTTMGVELARSVGGSRGESINSVAGTNDGGFIAGGSFASDEIQVGDYNLNNNGDYDGMIIKYSSEGEVEWTRSIGGDAYDNISSVAVTNDGGYIVGGSFGSDEIQVGEETLEGNSSYYRYCYDGMIIKYSEEGEVEWAKSVGGDDNDRINLVASTSDGGAIVGGYFASTKIQVGDYTLANNSNPGYDDGMIIKYSSSGEVEWARSVGGDDNDRINSVASTSDGGYIAGGYFRSDEIQVGDYTLTNNISGGCDGMIIKYSSSGEVEWVRSVGGDDEDYIESVVEINDGGYIVGGYFKGSNIQVGEYTLTNNSSGTYFSDGMIIKYSSSGEVEWARSVGGDADDEITSVTTTSAGEIIVGGSFGSDEIQVGDHILVNKGKTYTYDGMLIKYSGEGEIEWARNVGERSNEYISEVATTRDGSFIAGGSFSSDSIEVGDYTFTNNCGLADGSADGIIIKYDSKEVNNPTVMKAEGIGGSSEDSINSVARTSDGGYIAGGYFHSSSIQVGDYTLTNNGKKDGMIIKYNSEGKVEWARSVGGTSLDEITSVAETSDGGYLVGGYFQSNSIQVGEYTLKKNGYTDGLIIKYSSKGEVEWAKNIGGDEYERITSVTATCDGGAIVGGYFASESIQVGDYTLSNNSSSSNDSDGIIIKYSRNGEVEWARSVGGDDSEQITSVTATSDGGAIVGGHFWSESIQVGDYNLNNNGDYDGMIIKYSNEGEVEWARRIGGENDDEITSVAETSDGKIIAGGYFESDSIQVGDYPLMNSGESDGILIKYSSIGEVEWARRIGGENDDEITSVVTTKDGGYIAGGNFNSSNIQVGDYILDNQYSIGMIIEYSRRGEVEGAKSIEGVVYIKSVSTTSDGRYIAGGNFFGSTIEIDGKTLTNKGEEDGMILEIENQIGVPEIQELTVENSRKEFKITTDVKEIDGVKGGNISGEEENPYETVKYGDSSTKEIKMTPDTNYEIIGITVNGEEYPFEEESDGTYTMPQFDNVTEDKHIEVTYALKDNKLTINKVDSKTQEPLQGATFKIDQLEERGNPENAIGKIVENGEIYAEADTTNEITDVQGELTNNGTYYFVQNTDGTLTPTNGKTYQTANGGTAGIGNTTANSYIEIDLSNLEGQYIAVVNANVSSQSSNDYGYATITQTTSAPSYSNSTGRIFRISGTSTSSTTPTDYESETLEGGNKYYLHLGYRKSSSTDTGDDQLVVNSIKIYGTNSSTYNFVENSEGGYESTNQGKNNTTANSYIPIDLTELTGKYDLILNAQVSSENNYDYGYATVTNNTTAPAYDSSTGRFVYISGEQVTQEYTTVLQGGQMYYLHLGYYKDELTSSGDDKFTVNSIKITPNDSELYHTEVTTNSEGQGIVQLPFGKYQITEIEAPDGYQLLDAPVEIEFRADGDNHEITISNMESAKVIVHHYLKTNAGEYTTTKVADDELLEGKIDETYTTLPHLDLEKYELEKDTEGNYVIPANATGTYESGIIEVIYYYEEKDIPLTVHHYIEGTETPVPLKDGSVAQDITASGKEGEEYTTSPIEDSNLSDEYELVEIPENAEGKYSGDEIVVTYYYKIAQRPLTIIKTGEDGEPLSGVKFKIKKSGEENVQIGEITPNGEYYFVEKDGKYISNNQNKNSTTANSFIKIDLTGKADATIKINAEISSESGYDYGYATITETTTAPSYSSSIGRIFRISGQVEAKDYETTIEGGKIYYLHVGYRKDSSGNSYNDTFTINSIELNINEEEYTTNSEGKITTTLEAGEYEITETETQEGYQLPENQIQIIHITKNQEKYELNIRNERARGTVITHYYIEGTENKVPSNVEGQVVEDVIQTGKIGDIYFTEEATNVDDMYELKEVVGDVQGKIEEGTKEIIYYYGLKESNLTITKTNKEGEGLEGAVLKIENKENGKISYATTEEDGKVTTQVPIGKYIVTEIQAPEGYKLNKESIEVTIEPDKENIITIQDEKINYYNFELSKVDSETGELLSGAGFKLTYTDQYGEERIKNLTTDTSGKIILQDLEDEIVYTLEETESPIGYIKDIEEKQFVVHYANGKYEIQILKGNLKDLMVENNTIKAKVTNNPSLKIVKQDQNGIPIQGAKFTITDEEGNEVVDGNNNLVGEVEEINGEQLRVVTTNENGEITENLLAGKYIITEVQAPEGYEMPENEAERGQEIEIKASQVINISKDEELDFNNALDNLNFMFGSIQINNISACNNGTAIYGVLFNDLTIPKEYTANEEDIVLERGEGIEGGADGIIVYINYAGKVEDIKQIKSPKDTLNYLTVGSANKNEETIVIGLYMNSVTISGEQTESQEELTISNPEANAEVPGIYLITYNSNGKVSDLRDITYMLELIMNEPSMRTVSDKYILEGMPASDTFTVPAEETVDGQEITVNIIDGNPIMLVLNSEGKVITAQEEKYMETDKYNVETETLLTTGGMIVGGYANSNVIFTADETENGQELNLNNTANDGFIVKYNTEGKVSWANKIESENGYCGFNSIQEVSNGYIGIAYYYTDLKIQTVSGEELRFENENEVRVLIKFNGQGQIQWAKDIANDMSVVPEVIPIINEVQDGYVLLDYNATGNNIFYKETDLSTIPIEQLEIRITNTKLNTLNIPVSKIWEDDSDKLGKRPTRVVFKLTGSDGSEHTLELAKPGTADTTTTQDANNPNKWNDIFENLPRFDQNGNRITYTLTEEEKTAGDLKYYDTSIDTESNTVTNTSKYGKVTVHYYIMTPDGTTTTNKVPDTTGTEIPDVIIEGKEGDPYSTEEASNVSEKYELVEDATVGETEGTIEKYNEKEPQEVIYYYRLKPAKVIIHYLEKDGDADDSNNQVLATNEQIDGHVDDSYNTDTEHRKETIEKDGRTYTLVENSGNTTGTMTLQDTNVTYYYLQNTKATVRYVARDPETHEIIKDLETPYTEEGLVGDEFVTHSKDFLGYKLVESPEKTTIKMTKEEQTLIYYYEPVYTGLLENHIDDKTGKILYTETHDVQVGDNYKIPSKNFAGYDLVESKLPNNAEGTMGEELITVNYYYIKKAVLEVNYIDRETGKPLADQIIDDTKHEGDSYTTEEKTFNEYDMVQLEGNKEGTMVVETDEYGNITNNKTVVTYYYAKKSAGVEEHHIDIRTGEELEEPTLHEGHIGDDYNIPSKEFLSYVVATTDKDGNNVLPTNSTGKMTAEKIVVTYYYNQPAKVIVHYVDKTTGKELEETNPETGELQNSQVVIEGFNQDEYETTAKEFEYYTLIESPAEPNGTMKVEIVKDENGNDVVNNTIDVYYYYEPKPFNIGVEKEITGIIINGERRAVTNGKLEKVEIYRKSTESTSVQVEYKIKVSNTGEVRGNATIEENIPAGMSLANNDGTWEEQEGKLIKVIPEIGAGETKEYTVLLNWNTSGNNMGEKANEVKLVETGNVPGFKDNNDKDNTSNANVIISVETGELPIGLLIALVTLVGLETVTLRYAVVLTKKQKKK